MWILYLLIGAVVAFFVLAYLANKQVKSYFFQYAYFTRYATFYGLVLFFLPAAAFLAPSIAANLFVMNWIGAALTGLMATLYAWVIVYTYRLTWLSIPLRCKLSYKRGQYWKVAAKNIARLLKTRNYVVVDRPVLLWSTSILILPLLAFVVYRAEVSWWSNLLGVVLGVAAAFGLRAVNWFVWNKNNRYDVEWWNGDAQPYDITAEKNVFRKIGSVFLEVYRSFDISPGMRIIHRRASWFAMSTAFFVILPLGIIYCPALGLSAGLPAIVILLAFFTAMTSLFGLIGFVFDKDRIPVVLVVILVGIAIQNIIPNEHVYESSPWPEDSATSSSQALHNRIAKSDQDKPVIMVAASGGGIRAALWSAHVMEQLQNEIPQFRKQLGVISTVSGGSIGQMYYWDRFYLSEETKKDAASKAAETSSLAATVWGLTYLELPRLLLSSHFVPFDRGWAQETTWQQQLNEPTIKLSDLYPKVKSGDWPIPVFNSSFQETGQRYLISPVAMKPGPAKSDDKPDQTPVETKGDGSENEQKNLNTSEKNGKEKGNDKDEKKYVSPYRDSVTDSELDMKIVTAARLSASFPYATPQSQSQIATDGDPKGNREVTRQLHAADGGFYDNSGLISVLEIIDRFRERYHKESGKIEIALVEIRASTGDFETGSKIEIAPGGIATELLGPPYTVFNVLFGSQSARNREEINWLTELWGFNKKRNINVRHFVFYVGEGPLSWHLTTYEKELIRLHWPDYQSSYTISDADTKTRVENIKKHNEETLEELKKFMKVKSQD